MEPALLRPFVVLVLVASPGGREASSALGREARAPAATTRIRFEDATAAAGIHDLGISFGASAGDVDGDGWPDIYTSGHFGSHARLWRNNHNGTFVDIAPLCMQPVPDGDLHGAQWVDFDNDGVQELFVLRGANYGLGSAPKSLYRWQSAQLVDVAPQVGLTLPLMRARTPLAVDFDGDGRLDTFVAALLRPDGLSPPSLFVQQNGTFVDAGPGAGLVLGDTLFGVLGDLDGDHAADAMFQGYPTRAFRIDNGQLTDITAAIALPCVASMNDCAIADFNGDGENEIYFACDESHSAFHLDGPITLEFRAIVPNGEHQVRFSAGPGHFLWLDWAACDANDIFIGAGGLHPPPFGVVLSPLIAANAGVAPHAPGVAHGVYVGWHAATNEWSIACSSPAWFDVMLRVIGSQPLAVPYAVGFNPSPTGPSDRLFERVNGQYVDRSAAAGIPTSLHGHSVVAADFDNDMDLDLYVVTTTQSHNTPNVLLENVGGVFIAIPAGAAAGSSDGIGDVAIALDYDRDGLVDLFLVNGGAGSFRTAGSPGAFADDGPAQLLHNTSRAYNNWLGVELIGSTSNRQGIGARVEVLAGGVLQVRENGGGMHAFAQNHGLHFGLAANASATVVVTWPSGKRTVRSGVTANQYLTVIE